MTTQQLSQYQEDLKQYRELRAELEARAARASSGAALLTRVARAQLWSDAFVEERGRRPDRTDVNSTGIQWLVRRNALFTCVPHSRACARRSTSTRRTRR